MKFLALTALSLFTANAQAGFFACTSESGLVITAGIDGEANVTALRAISADGETPDAELRVEAIDPDGFSLTASRATEDDTVTYVIKSTKNKGIPNASLRISVAESVKTEKATCVVKFEADSVNEAEAVKPIKPHQAVPCTDAYFRKMLDAAMANGSQTAAREASRCGDLLFKKAYKNFSSCMGDCKDGKPVGRNAIRLK